VKSERTDDEVRVEYEAARQVAAAENERWDIYTGSNPNKRKSTRDAADRQLRELDREMKERRLLPISEWESLCRELDAKFPDARSRQIVEYKGQRYRRRFYPSHRSRSGKTVHSWDATWEKLI